MEIINITKARSNLFNLISDVIHGEPKCIKTREGNAFVISQADWEEYQEMMHILTDPVALRALQTPSCEEEWSGEESLAWNVGH